MSNINSRNKQINKSSLNQVGRKAFSPSSLLIPKHHQDFFKLRKAQFKGIANYFHYLLLRYITTFTKMGIIPSYTSQKWKKQYQKPRRNLKKVCFIPDPCLWEAYRQVSEQYGISICHLFVIAMRLDWYDWLMDDCPEDVPTIPIKQGYRKYLTKWPNKLINLNNHSYSFQKIDFNNKVLVRTGRFRLKPS